MRNQKAVDQLVLDCATKVLRINETTDAEIDISILGYIGALSCDGYKHGYYNSKMKTGFNGKAYPERDFVPIRHTGGLIYFNNSVLSDDAEPKLRNLLNSLDTLEKELLSKPQEAKNENHE
jgi:hypothetical protein